MAQTVIEKVRIVELTKFGFKDGTGAYVGWSKLLKDSAKTPIVPGRTFDMELYIADSGKKYVNKVLAERHAMDTPVTSTKLPVAKPPVIKADKPVERQPDNPTNTPPKTEDKPMTRDDWDSKDRRISRQGAIQAAVQAVATLCPLDEVFISAKELAEKMLAFVNEK